MATYTITIDERTKSDKRVIDYLKSHGVYESGKRDDHYAAGHI